MWNLKCSNKIMDRRIKYKAHMKHIEALHNIKGQMNITSPIKPTFLHDRQKSKQLEAEKKSDIQHKNDILIEKMFRIQSNIPPRKYLNDSFRTYSSNKSYKKRVQREIDLGNQLIIKKLQETESCYPVHQILRETNNYLYYKSNILNASRHNPLHQSPNKSVSKINGFTKVDNINNRRPFSAPKN